MQRAKETGSLSSKEGVQSFLKWNMPFKAASSCLPFFLSLNLSFIMTDNGLSLLAGVETVNSFKLISTVPLLKLIFRFHG